MKLIKKILSVFLCLTVIIGSLSVGSFSVSAASVKGNRGADGKGFIYKKTAEYTYTDANGKKHSQHYEGWENFKVHFFAPSGKTLNFLDYTQRAYCIEPDKASELTSSATVKSTSQSAAWKQLTTAQQNAVNLILSWGFGGFESPSENKVHYYYATQLLIFEIVAGKRNASTVGTFTTSATSVKKTFSSLAQGMYYIKATNYPAGVKSVTNSVVSLPYYNNGWVYSINAIDLATKVNDGDVVTGKTITNSTKDNTNFTDVSLGDTVNFEIKSSTAGSSEMKLKSYTVYDEMSAGLTLDKDSVKVALLNAQGSKVADLASSDYALNVTSEVDGKATTFNVSIANAYLQKNDFYAENVAFTSVTYSAKLNKYAVAGKTGNPNTETKLVYSNKNGVESEVNGNTVYVYTFAVTTNKTDTDGKALEGAEFSLFKTEEDATALTNAIASGVSDKTGKVTYYNTSKEEIKLASGKYYIVETKAPTGYNIYGKVIPVTIDVTYSTTFVDGSYITNCPTDGTASVDVKDTKVVVPQTGGAGTVMFYILGTAFALGGIATLLIRRRVKATNK